MRSTAVEILLVEDNAGDARLVKEALKESRVPNHVYVIEDGEEALAFLRREGQYQHAVRPDLIILDLNLPRKDSRVMLAEIKADPSLRRIPVLILTSSRAESDVVWAYEQGASCYLLKPVSLEAYFKVMQAMIEFWGSYVCLPPP
ncbi:MAG: response regulator [Thermodesulfobacteriota bacterium]